MPGGQDQLIPDDGVLDLTAPGVERVVLGPKPVPGFEVAVIYNGQVKPQRVTENEQMQSSSTARVRVRHLRAISSWSTKRGPRSISPRR